MDYGLSSWIINGLWILKLKFALINEGELNRKLPKMFAGKNLQMT